MLSENYLQEIIEYEENGVDIIALVRNGTLHPNTQGTHECKYCDQCSAFRLVPDPNPYDWFRNGDMKAVCLEVNGVISGSLEKPSEWTNIRKPLYCPKLGRKLNEDEKKVADRLLELAHQMM